MQFDIGMIKFYNFMKFQETEVLIALFKSTTFPELSHFNLTLSLINEKEDLKTAEMQN